MVNKKYLTRDSIINSQLNQLIERFSHANPEKIAICTEDKEITYQQLYDLVEKVSNNLQALNPQEKCLAILLPNSIEIIISYLACFKLGIVAALVNYNSQASEVESILRSVEATGLIIHDEKLLLISQIELDKLKIKNIFVVDHQFKQTLPYLSFSSLYVKSAAPHKISSIQSDKDAIIFHTSGSTGIPKGVVHTSRSVLGMLKNVNEAVQATEKTTMLIPLPLWHIGGFTHAMSKLMIGATAIIMRKNGVDDNLFAALYKYNPNMMIMHIPSFYDLLYHPKFNAKIFSQMTECIAGGDKLPIDLQKKFYAATNIYLRECYGMTEANLLTINRENNFLKCGSIGKAINGVNLKLMKSVQQEAGINELGEIYCQGENRFAYYWKNQTETNNKIISGWLRTHDVARRDKDGFLWFLGRVSELIHRSDEVMSPLEIEEIFYTHPAVKMAAVTAIPDDKLGQAAKAYIVLKQNHSVLASDLKVFVNKKNPSMTPDEIVFVNDLPRGKTGKIDRHLLRTMNI